MSIHEYHLRLLGMTTVAQNLLQEFLVNASEELLAQSLHIAQPNQTAVSTILSPHIKIFEKDTILKIPNNKGKVFDVKGTGIVLNNPDVSTFDVSMLCAILKRIPNFETHIPDKANRCVNNCIQKCCRQCNHKKVDCGNTLCLVSFTECRFKKNLCCPRCQICGFCLGPNPVCDIYILKKNLDIIRRTRNVAAHGNMDEFSKLEKNGIPLEDFPNSNSWNSLSVEINNAVHGILSYMENPQNFNFSNKIITPKQKNDYEIEMKIACEGSAIIVERNFNGAVFQLVTQMQESNEELEHLTGFLRNCIENKLIDIHVMLSNHINNFNKFDEQNEERYKVIERVLEANRKTLETLDKKYAVDIEAVKNDIKIQKGEQIKLIERLEVTETDVDKLKGDQDTLTETMEDAKADIQSQTLELVIVKERIDVTEAELMVQKNEHVKVKKRVDVTESEFLAQKVELVKVIERIDVTEAEVVAQKVEHVKVKERIDVTEAELVAQKVEQFKIKEQVDLNESELVAQKAELVKVKEEVVVTKAELVAQKCEHLKLKERIDVTEAEMSTIKDKIECSKAEMDQTASTNRVLILDELIRDDSFSHSFKMKDSNWYITCHHDTMDQPEILINTFDRKIYAPGNKRVLKSYQCGFTKYDNEADYAKYLIEKFDEQFGKDLIDQPWLLTNLHEDCVENRNFYQLCRDVYSFCQNKKYSFLLIDVSIEDNLRNLGFNMDKVKEKLNVYEAEDPAHRILVYIGESDVILNIRHVDSNEEKDISNAVRKGQVDTKLFCSLYQDVLQKTGISFVCMVVANTSKKNLLEISTCSECMSENLIVPSSGLFTSLESIVNKMEERNFNKLSSVVIESTFIDLSSRLWSTLCIRDVHLPNICTDRDSALERIYLNGAQRRFLHSKKKHAILRGGFGSGKSILAQEKFKYLIQNATGTEDIFYLCFNDETLFKGVLKEQISENVNHQLRPEQVCIMNSDEYGKKFGLLPPVMFSEILQDMNERYKTSSNKPHVIADEFDSNNLTSNEADCISNILPDFKDSHVLLIPQSLDTVRKRIISQRFGKQEEKYAGQEFERTGMSITMLDSIMRNTTSINELSQGTIRELEKHKSKIYLSDSPVPIEFDTKDAQSDDVEHDNRDIVTYIQMITDSYSASENITEAMKIYNSLNRSIGHNLKELNLQRILNVNLPTEQQFREDRNSIPVNFYHVLKKMNTSIEKSSSKAIESQFRFPGKGNHGHKVMGNVPKLINPFKNIEMNYHTINETEIKMRLLFALQNIINVRKKCEGMAVIVFEPIEAQLFHAIFLSMDIDTIVYTPAISTGLTQTSNDDMVNKLKDHVLVTDHIGARALEFKYLIVTVNPNEIFLYQYLVEAFTRCLYELSFIVFKTGVKKKGTFCSGNIIKRWKKNNLVQKYEIEVCKLHGEDGEYSDIYCKKKNCCYHIHTWHEDLKPAATIDHIKYLSESDEQLRVQYNKLLSPAYLEEEVTQKQEEQDFTKKCSRRGYKTYKDIILGNDKGIVDMLLKVKDGSYIRNYRDVEGNSLLEIAIRYDCIDSLKSMSVSGLRFPLPKENICVDVILANKKEQMGLLLKCSNRDESSNFQDVDGNSLLEVAFLHGCSESTEAILQFGLECSLNYEKLNCKDIKYLTEFRDLDGNSLLELAFLHCYSDSIEAMVQFGLECSLSYEKLIAQNDKQVVYLLMRFKRKSILDYRDIHGNTLMHIASENGWFHFVEAMSYSVLRVIRNNDNKLPIDLALTTGNESIINLLVKADIYVERMIKEYESVNNKGDYLRELISGDRRDELSILLSNCDLISQHEWTLLYNAVVYDEVYLLELFIQFGCNIDLKDNNGNTALHYAALGGSKSIIDLLSKDLDVGRMIKEYENISDKDNYLRNLIRNDKRDELYVILSNRELISLYEWTLLYNAAYYNKVYLLELFIHYGCYVGLQNRNGITVLHYAAWYGSVDVVKFIFDKYPHLVGVTNNNENTALHYAAYNGNEKLVKIILDKYPHMVDVTNNNGDTALHVAAYNGKVEAVRFILEKCPHIVDVKNKNGDTAYEL